MRSAYSEMWVWLLDCVRPILKILMHLAAPGNDGPTRESNQKTAEQYSSLQHVFRVPYWRSGSRIWRFSTSNSYSDEYDLVITYKL